MKWLPVLIPLLLTNLCTRAQADSNAFTYPHLDTLVTFNVFLQAEISPTQAKYYVNGEEVRKIIYDNYRKFFENIGKCRPCFLITYDTQNNLLSESVNYTDCIVGAYRSYYKNGKLKETGSYKVNSSGDWQNLADQGYCRKTGKWIYYGPNGAVLKTEWFVEGNKVK